MKAKKLTKKELILEIAAAERYLNLYDSPFPDKYELKIRNEQQKYINKLKNQLRS